VTRAGRVDSSNRKSQGNASTHWADRHRRQHTVNEVCGRLNHPACATRRTEAAPFAGEGHQTFVAAARLFRTMTAVEVPVADTHNRRRLQYGAKHGGERDKACGQIEAELDPPSGEHRSPPSGGRMHWYASTMPSRNGYTRLPAFQTNRVFVQNRATHRHPAGATMPKDSWWKRALGRTTRRDAAATGSTDAPHRPAGTTHVDLIPGHLSSDIYSHEVRTNTGPLACWSYVSHGLQQFRQPEIVFTLLRKPRETIAPEEPLKLFRTIHKLSHAGQVVKAGGVTQFGDDGFFGRHLVYIAAQQMPDVAIPIDAICAVLVTRDELQAVLEFGTTRVMALLGNAARYYPCPPWSDRSRPGIPFAAVRQATALTRVAPLLRPGCSIYQANGAVVLFLNEASRSRLAAQIEIMPDEVAFGLLTEIDDAADGCLFWQPGQTAPEAISPHGSTGQRICGCFLLFATGQKEDEIRQVEDGFAAILTSSSWRTVKDAIKRAESIRILPAKPSGFPFVVEFAATSRIPVKTQLVLH
jgi:hypothetical protein